MRYFSQWSLKQKMKKTELLWRNSAIVWNRSEGKEDDRRWMGSKGNLKVHRRCVIGTL